MSLRLAPLRYALVLVASAALAACQRPAEPVAAAPAAPAASPPALVVPAPLGTAAAKGIAWQPASTDAEVDAAFAQARAAQKPVLLYWGAEWCPPCNQLKATLFNRQDFIERTRAFVPVYVDGDQPGAQKLGARFKVRGYPTMVLLSPAGQEMTRLPGEVDAQQVTQMLTLGLAMQRPVKAVLADARAGRSLGANEWQLLAFYSWDTDEQAQVLPPKELPATLRALAAACPPEQADAGTRLFLKAWAAAEAPRPDAQARERFLAVLRSAEASRVQMDVLANNAQALAKAFAPAGDKARGPLLEAFDASLAGLANDMTLSRADRASASIARVQLARLDAPKGPPKGTPKSGAPVSVPPALMSDIREQVARLDRETTDGYERQAVIPTLAYLLREAGAPAESDALLKANLARSHSPYYLMSSLASNAKKRGDTAEALRWSEEAYRRSVGPATRLQWGASHVALLVELAPQDEQRIEAAALQVLREAAGQPNAFYERSARSLQRVGDTLARWQKAPGHADAMKRLQAELEGLCAAVPEADAQRDTCLGLLSPKPVSSQKPSA
ncbi:thioredoxin fold domain-containing protein [Piscinibacter sp. HJYY11]|uniref:thioredoxin family protein n=1 Tax=Piscinibacter sp. HJYY11 TaxID=2801333 RepID=UPI00191E5923|nr:thioredoxin fold domain-containing protein [Piscinibacter sp. HJYY11]MBL0729127.1 thioredoxin fold domain-containing protein [Piscinibacter sp. HJYY11]